MQAIVMGILLIVIVILYGYVIVHVGINKFWDYMYKKHKKPESNISMADFRLLMSLYWRVERQERVRRAINRVYFTLPMLLSPIALALDSDLLIDWTNKLIRLYRFKLYSSYFNRVQKGTTKPNYIRVESVERKSDVAFITLIFEGDSFANYSKYVKSCLSYYAQIPKSSIHCQKIDSHHLLCLTPENC